MAAASSWRVCHGRPHALLDKTRRPCAACPSPCSLRCCPLPCIVLRRATAEPSAAAGGVDFRDGAPSGEIDPAGSFAVSSRASFAASHCRRSAGAPQPAEHRAGRQRCLPRNAGRVCVPLSLVSPPMRSPSSPLSPTHLTRGSSHRRTLIPPSARAPMASVWFLNQRGKKMISFVKKPL
jgi:hypothetical protein